jgi:hypothetical protein
MDLHLLNTSPAPVNVSVVVNLLTIPQSQMKQEAGIYFFYNPFIRVPAAAPGHARMSCPITSEVTLTNMQTHMHKQGLGGVANLADASGNPMQMLYTSNTWLNPIPKAWASGLSLQAGQHIDYECSYQNDGPTDIIQGLSAAHNEMCVLAGTYYPRDLKFEDCSTQGTWDNLSSAATFIGTGAADGATTLGCIMSATAVQPTDNDKLFGCIVDSCPKIAPQLTSLIDCAIAAGSVGATTCSSQIGELQQTACQ